MIIAMDGPAGAGKSTAARAVAARFRLGYLDTGAMYRCVTLAALRDPAVLADPVRLAALAERCEIRFGPLEHGRQQVWLDGLDVTQAIREEALTEQIKKVSQVPAVRAVLVRRQQTMGRALDLHHGGCVVEGRDIGSVVFADSPAKFWLVADLAVRASRRSKDAGSDSSAIRQTVMLDKRDAADKNPALGSLMQAPDAVVLDTTHLTVDEVVAKIAAHAKLRAG